MKTNEVVDRNRKSGDGEFTEDDHKRYNQRVKALEPIKAFLKSIIHNS